MCKKSNKNIVYMNELSNNKVNLQILLNLQRTYRGPIVCLMTRSLSSDNCPWLQTITDQTLPTITEDSTVQIQIELTQLLEFCSVPHD